MLFKKYRTNIFILSILLLFALTITCESSHAISDTSTKSIPKGGTLYAKVWRTTGDGTESGNSKKWDYLVSASYKGSQKVTAIRCTWRSSASLRKSAEISIGISGSGGSASASSTWQTVKSKEKYWENSNGAKESSWSSNITVGPKKHYEANTIYTYSKAKLKLKGHEKYYTITASV